MSMGLAGRNPRFDLLYTDAAARVQDQTHLREKPPVEGGRWPASILLRPPMATRRLLESWMRDALVRTGPGHFLTGLVDSVHLTVRALEPRRETRRPGDPEAVGWRRALAEVAETTPPLRFALTGVTLTRGTVMAQVEPVDDEPWLFLRSLADALGPLGWYEAQWPDRDIWYANLVHFAGPIEDPAGLVTWVRARRVVEPVPFTVDAAELVTFRSVIAEESVIFPRSWARESLRAQLGSEWPEPAAGTG